MASIKIAFYNFDTFYGRVIKRATNGNFSHCGIVAEEISDKVVTYEALSKGFTRIEYNRSTFENWKVNGTVEVIELETAVDTINLLEVLDKLKGTPYGWLDIFHIALAIIFKDRVIKYSDGAKTLICSEAVGLTIYNWSKGVINLSKILNKPMDMLTPQNIYEWLKNKKNI